MEVCKFVRGTHLIVLHYCRNHYLPHVEFTSNADINPEHFSRSIKNNNDISISTFIKYLIAMQVDPQQVLDFIKKHAIDDQPQVEKPSPPKAKRKRKRLPKS